MEGYFNGSDMLLIIDGKAAGHCSTHTVQLSSETKDRAVKPLASKPRTNGKFKNKTVTGQSITVNAEGLVYYGETENGYKALLKAWKEGKPVKLKCMERGDSSEPYLEGNFVVTSLERSDPADEDSTWSATFENDGEPDVLDESVLSDGIEETD